MSERQRRVEEEFIGETVEKLYAAISEPINTTYAASHMVENAEDGQLQYDGFTVLTARFLDGDEYVMGTQ